MPIGAGLRAFLLGDVALSAAVGGSRIYPVVLPQGAVLPAVTYLEVSAARPHASPQGPLGHAGSRIQVDTWATTYAGALDLAELIRKRLDGYRGPAGAEMIQGAFLDGSREFYEDVPRQWRVSRDYIVWYREQI